MSARVCVVVATNDDTILERNLLRSEMIRSGRVDLHLIRGAPSAGEAYNRGIDDGTAPIIVFAHQDVYFPKGWDSRLLEAVDALDHDHPDWGVIAPFGMSKAGEHLGRVWTTSLTAVIGRSVSRPTDVEAFDELAIIMRRDSSLRFDPKLPGFHLYGTDIVQEAKAQGFGTFVVDLPVVHNDKFYPLLGRDFGRAYHYVRRKWRRRLPVRTPVLWIRWHGLDLPWYHVRSLKSVRNRRSVAGDTSLDPVEIARKCGWEGSGTTGLVL